MYRDQFNRIYGARYDLDAITAQISTQPSIVIPFILSSPGLELPLCCGSRSFAPGTGGQPAACERVFVRVRVPVHQ